MEITEANTFYMYFSVVFMAHLFFISYGSLTIQNTYTRAKIKSTYIFMANIPFLVPKWATTHLHTVSLSSPRSKFCMRNIIIREFRV